MPAFTAMRADLLLVARGLAPSRQRARELIAAGAVQMATAAGRQTLRKASAALPDDAELAVDEAARPRHVSRGGLKLEGALSAAGIDPRGLVCLDLGQSTGGFTDCLLQAGAARVVGVDVGHGQLHPSLRSEPRVQAFEGLNVRMLAGGTGSGTVSGTETGTETGTGAGTGAGAAAFAAAVPAGGFDLAVADLSFISLTHALAPAASLLRRGGTLLALVKPQFEVGPRGVGARGIVRDPRLYGQVRERIEQAARGAGLMPLGWYDSPIRGGDGNREFFLHARK